MIKLCFTYIVLVFSISGCENSFIGRASSYEQYQKCIEDIRLADEILKRSRTLACRRKVSTLSEDHIPVGNANKATAELLDDAERIRIKNLKNESHTKIIAGIEMWIAIPNDRNIDCKNIKIEQAKAGNSDCVVRYSNAPLWLAPGDSANVEFDVGFAKLKESINWSWGFNSYRYFEMSPTEFDQSIEQYERDDRN